MRSFKHRHSLPSILLFALVLAHGAWAPPAVAQSPEFTHHWVPIFQLDGEDYTVLGYAEINNSGQIGGTARGLGQTVAIRYTPGGDMENLHPPGAAYSQGVKINDAGQVFGYARANSRQTDVFLNTPGEGTDFLETGKGRIIKTTFRVMDMNNEGDIVGYVTRGRGQQAVPFIHYSGEGWRNLAGVERRFNEGDSAIAKYINDQGDMVFTVAPRGGRQIPFSWTNGKVRQMGRSEYASSGKINMSGMVAGSFSVNEREQAFLFNSRNGRYQDISIARFPHTNAGWITENNVVGGTVRYQKGGTTHGIFVFDRSAPAGRKFRIIVRQADIRTALPDGIKYVRYSAADMNENLQFSGTVFGLTAEGADIRIPFFASEEAGVVLLDSFIDFGGRQDPSGSVLSMNDRGEVLVEVDEGPESLVIVSPVN